MTAIITQAIKKVALAVHGTNQNIGEVSSLNTQAKTLVGAINEILIANQNTPTTQSVGELIDSKIAELTGGASDAFNTLKELEDAIANGKTGVGELTAQLGALKERVDTLDSKAQSLQTDMQAIKEYIGQDDDLLNTIETALSTGV